MIAVKHLKGGERELWPDPVQGAPIRPRVLWVKVGWVEPSGLVKALASTLLCGMHLMLANLLGDDRGVKCGALGTSTMNQIYSRAGCRTARPLSGRRG